MPKRAIVDEIEQQFGSRAAADSAVEAVFDAVQRIVNRGETVQIRGFGSFAMKERKGRIGRNPATGESISIPAKRQMTFKLPRKGG